MKITYEQMEVVKFVMTDNSMEPKIPKGAVVVGDLTEKVKDGDFAVVFVEDSIHEPACVSCQVFLDKDNVTLHRINPDYKDNTVNRDNIANMIKLVGFRQQVTVNLMGEEKPKVYVKRDKSGIVMKKR